MSDPILDMLERLCERPTMYIGQHSVESLFLFLAGYKASLRDHTDHNTSRYDVCIDSLYAKYGHGGGGHSWARVLSEAANGDAAGLDLFFAELAMFRNPQAPGLSR